MNIWNVIPFFWLALMPCFAEAASGSKGFYSDYYDRVIKPKVIKKDQASDQENFESIQAHLQKSDLSADDRYALQRQSIFFLENLEKFDLLKKSIEKIPIRSDDYLLQSVQILYSDSLDYSQKARSLEALFELTLKENPKTEMAAWIAFDLSGLMIEKYDLARATGILQRALTSLPEESFPLRVRLNESIARLYTDPGNSLETIKQGLTIYTQVEKDFRSEKQELSAQVAGYNIGIVRLFMGDFAGALEPLSRLAPTTPFFEDAKVFKSFALLRLNRHAEAKALLKTVELTGGNSKRIPFLQCYMAIVKVSVGDGNDISACTHLPEDTQGDVIQHMTQEILKLPLSEASELLILRQFQNFYYGKIRPQYQQRTSHSTDALELERAQSNAKSSRMEANLDRIKRDLANKRSELVVYASFSLTALLMILSFAVWRTSLKNQKIQQLQQFIQTRILQRFLPPTLVEEILQGRSRLEEAPQKRLVTILFADLVNFTATSEQLGADRIANLLNTWLRSITEVVFAENGTIDKFIGDAVMVIFGAPLELHPADQVSRAVSCAKKMMHSLEDLNKIWSAEFGISFQMRVGINLGEAIVGSFGSEKRSDYTVIGSTVNLASRIENTAEPGQILLSKSAAHYIEESLRNSVGKKHLKGILEAQELFIVTDAIAVPGLAGNH